MFSIVLLKLENQYIDWVLFKQGEKLTALVDSKRFSRRKIILERAVPRVNRIYMRNRNNASCYGGRKLALITDRWGHGATY